MKKGKFDSQRLYFLISSSLYRVVSVLKNFMDSCFENVLVPRHCQRLNYLDFWLDAIWQFLLQSNALQRAEMRGAPDTDICSAQIQRCMLWRANKPGSDFFQVDNCSFGLQQCSGDIWTKEGRVVALPHPIWKWQIGFCWRSGRVLNLGTQLCSKYSVIPVLLCVYEL